MSITLDAIRAAADAKYGSYDIVLSDDSTTKLLNPLRLSEQKRAELTAVQDELSSAQDDDAASVDQLDVFRRMVRIVAETQGQAERLLDAVGDDLALLAEIVSGYGKSTQQGEASASAA